MDAAPVVAVEDLRKTYRSGLVRRRHVEALKGVSLAVQRGEIFGLLGPNGAGKTTLIKILLGIIRRSAGKAMVLGRKAGDRRGRKQIGYLPENHRIPRHLTGYTALEYYGQLSNLPLSEIRRKRDQMLAEVGLSGQGPVAVKRYSKGMLQRIGLAQAMLHEPELLILDEPTDGVDPVGRAEIRNTLFSLKERGTTIFLNSHLLQEVELVCDRVAVLHRGNIVHVGPVQDLTNAQSNDIELTVCGEEAAIQQAFNGFAIASQNGLRDGAVSAKLAACPQEEIDRLVDALRANRVSIVSLSRSRLTLEQAFLQLVEGSPRTK